MSTSDDQLCSEIVEWFRAQPGWDAERLATDSVRKIPDLEARDEQDRYVIEVKQKGDDPQVSDARESDLSSGEVADFSEPAQRTSLGKVMRAAVKQVTDRAADDVAVLRIIWIQCEGGNTEGQTIQVTNAAFGSCTIWQLDGPLRDGYYIRESAFYRHRHDLDGIVVLDARGAGRLLLNNHSPRADRLRASGLVQLFRQEGVDAVVDPITEERTGRAFVADGDVPRSDEATVLRHLKRKYGTGHIMTMDMASSAGVIRPSAVPAAPASKPEPTTSETAQDRWYLHADFQEIIEAVSRALPEPWECGSIGLRSGPHEAVAKVRRRSDGQTSTIRIDLLEKRVHVDDLERLA